MAVSTFDTLNAMRGLEAAGIDPKQAEAITNAVRDAVMEGTATKGDILRVDNDVNTGFASLNGKIDALATETRAEIERLNDKVDGLATKAAVDALATETRAEIKRLNGEIERLNDKVDGLATKAMVDALATETKADSKRLDGKIDALAKDTKADIARLETRMLMAMIVVAGIIVAAVKYL